MTSPLLRQLASSLTLGVLGLSAAHAQSLPPATADRAVPSLSPVVVSGESATRGLDPGPQRVQAEQQACLLYTSRCV